MLIGDKFEIPITIYNNRPYSQYVILDFIQFTNLDTGFIEPEVRQIIPANGAYEHIWLLESDWKDGIVQANSTTLEVQIRNEEGKLVDVA